MSLYVKYLVCYDISNTRTRSKFFDFLKDLGLTPIQKSVFFGDLKTPEVRSLKPENRGIYTQSDSSKKSSRNIWSLAVVSVDQRY